MNKWLIRMMTVMVMAGLMGLQAHGAPRVVVEVEVMTDHSAKVDLAWSDGSDPSDLMIRGWSFSDRALTVSYGTEASLAGFNSRTIGHETYAFPMKVFLQEGNNQAQEFSDLKGDAKAYDAVMNLYYRGIISGYPDGTFLASNPVTRAEFSKMLMTTAAYPVDGITKVSFTDLAENHWAKAYIDTLADKGIVNGKGNGVFDPEGQIKVGEVLAVLTRTFNLYGESTSYRSTLTDHWSNPYFLLAVEEGLVMTSDDIYSNYDPEAAATRQVCAVLLSRVLENLHDVTE